MKFLPAPPGRAVIVDAWLPGRRRFLVEVGPRSLDSNEEFHLYTMRPDGSALVPLGGTRERPCGATAEDSATPVHANRFVYWSICFRSPRGDRRMRSLRIYDFRTGTSAHYARRYFRLFEVGGFAFSPRLPVGILSLGDRLSNRLYWLRTSGLTAVRGVPFTNAGTPAWSPDGKSIAVDGIPRSAGPDEATRTDVPWSLYLMDSRRHRFRTLVDGLTDNAPAEWSPDSRWLAAALAPKQAPAGIWIVNARNGERRLLLRGTQYRQPLWLSGRRLAVPVLTLPGQGYHGFGTLLVTLPASALR